MKNGLFNFTVIRYETALGVIGAVIARCAAQLGDEIRKPAPDADTIRILQARQRELETARTSLQPHNAEAIEQVIAEYAGLARHQPQGLARPQSSRPQE